MLCVRPNAKGPEYEEIVIPERLREFNVSFSGIAAFSKAAHAMDNYICLELARRWNKVPAYTSSIAPEIGSQVCGSKRTPIGCRAMEGNRATG